MKVWLAASAALMLAGCESATPPRTVPSPTRPVSAQEAPRVAVRTLREDGGRLAWAPRGDVIAFDRAGEDGFFDIYTTTTAGGTAERCLTCGTGSLPQRHIGNPAWHPSGDYIVFQAQRAGRGLGRLTDFFANPGSGVANDVWMMDRAGERFWQITTVPRGYGGVLHPHFSHDGRKLLWSERVGARGGEWGRWALKVADVAISNGAPRVTGVRTFQPGANREFYESHGFDRTGRRILFSGNVDRGQREMALDICWMDLDTGVVTNLTRTSDEWDEHAQLSPDGRRIVWMTSRDIGMPRRPVDLKTDYWIMNADGSDQRRLTHFNEKGHAAYIEGGVAAADASWSPDGTRLAAYLITDPRAVRGRMVILDLAR